MTSNLTLTILFDNYEAMPGLETDWGFSCLVETGATTLLFDTGGNGPLLLRNMRTLGHDPQELDGILLSHEHGDHTGGLASVLQANSEVTVFVPASFSAKIKRQIVHSGAELCEIGTRQEIAQGMLTTGDLSGSVREQSLVCEVGDASLLITGCAHPGIVKIAREASALSDLPLRMALGGFHLGSASERALNEIIQAFEAIGITHAGPSHCSGDKARRAFQRAYGEGYLELGVGSVIRPGEFL